MSRKIYALHFNFGVNHALCINPKLRSLWRRANTRKVSFFTLYGGQFTFSTQLLTLNYLLYSPTDAATQFPWKLTPFNDLKWNSLYGVLRHNPYVIQIEFGAKFTRTRYPPRCPLDVQHGKKLFLQPRLLYPASLIPVIIIFLCLPILAYLCLFYHELDNYFIEKENQDLRGEKRAVEESLKNEITKPQKLEEKLDGTERSSSITKREPKIPT